jgi:hypothetical protein
VLLLFTLASVPAVMKAQVIDPSPWIDADEFALSMLESVIPLVTVSVTPVFTDKVPDAAEVGVPNWTDEIVAFAVTVIVCPAAIITDCPAVGTVPPGHGALGVVEFQLPDPAVVTWATEA